MLPSDLYNQRLADGRLTADAGQAAALAALDRLAQALASRGEGNGLFTRLFGMFSSRAQAAPRGLYLYGPVGRGKSLLMDLLFASMPDGIAKRRQHFHQFMRDTHRKLSAARTAGASDPLGLVTAELAATMHLLCFDELFVKDVADAMILSRLFTGLIEAGVAIVFTTNCAPDELYAGGLQRARFLPFIDLIKTRLKVIDVAGPEDHRLRHLQSAGTYITGTHAATQLGEVFARLTNGATPEPASLLVEGRVLILRRAAAGVLWTSFAELCQSPLGPADMLEIAACFHTILLDGVPVMGGSNGSFGADGRNEVVRFITLIDALYDAHRNLVIAAAAQPDALYQGGPLAFEFQRTASRLIEMQAREYAEHQGN